MILLFLIVETIIVIVFLLFIIGVVMSENRKV